MTAPALSVPTANGRYYQFPAGGRGMVPSITNIIGTMDKPALKYWSAKECANYASRSRTMLATLTEQEAFQLVRNAPFQRTDDSPAAIGDIVHGWIDRYIGGDAPTHDEITQANVTARNMWGSFLKFVEYYQPTFTGHEFTVWSDKHGYAGTADISMMIGGLHVLADTKTGKAVYPETAMQIAAIAKADVIVSHAGEETPVPVYSRYAVLHLRPRSATLHPVDRIDEAFECFLGLKKAFDWKVEHADKSIGFAPQIN